MKTVELLAPAGSYKSLHSAINAGADAVYFGITHLNMRAGSSAQNFTLEDLKEIADICHAKNVKTYITLNTIVYDREAELMKSLINSAKKNGIDAVIAADVAAIGYCHEIGQEVHCSTQLSISNINAVKFYSQFVDRVVLARELDLKQIRFIADQIKEQDIRGPKGNLIEIEAFIHGAMCISVSGRCFMSAFEHNLSANRGLCRQMCRRAYKITDTETGDELKVQDQYVMSPQDLCAIDFLDKVIDSGIYSLKIEGRGRSPDYVHTVVTAYKKALDAIENKTYDEELIEELFTDLKSVYNRGLSKGFYFGRPVGAWSRSYGSVATTRKLSLGKVTHYFPKKNVAEIIIQAEQLKTGDEVYIIGNTTGTVKQKISELRDEEGEVIEHAKKGDIVTFVTDSLVRANDEVFVIVDIDEEGERLKDRVQN